MISHTTLWQCRLGSRLGHHRQVAAFKTPCPASHLAKCRFAQLRRLACRAQDQAQQVTSEDNAKTDVAKPSTSSSTRPKGKWVPVIKPEDLPKGVRKEVRVGGVDVLLFWYRNEIFAIEAKSPAEGAYSEGFISSGMNQDYCIECPGTGSMFDFRTGEIKSWYPTNAVLRFLTPQSTCRELQTFPVRLEQDNILIDVSNTPARDVARGSGGSMAMFGNDNVYGKELKPVLDSQTDNKSALDAGTVATSVVGITAAVSLLVAGTATLRYWQSDLGLYAFWAFYVVGGILFVSGKVRL